MANPQFPIVTTTTTTSSGEVDLAALADALWPLLEPRVVASFPGQKSTGPALPNQVTGLTAVVVGGGGITVPQAPTIGTATRGNASASVTFTANGNGGSAITGFTATSTPGGFTTSGASSPLNVTGLANGTSYTFTVHATNAIGNSAESAASNSVTPATVPGAPTIGTATAGAGSASVAFTAPGSNGGSAITGYTATSSPGGITGTGTSSPITVSGLTGGQAYTFTVTATNAVGTGAASAASNSVTPSAGTFAAVGNFLMARQGDITNGVSDGTQNGTTFTVNWTYSGTACDHFIVYGRQDYVANAKIGTVPYAGNGNYSFTFTSATNAYSAGNIGEANVVIPDGQTTIWDFDVIASDASESVLGPFPADFQFWMYMGAANQGAWSGSQSYRVGDVVSSGGTNYFCTTAHTNHSPPNSTYWYALSGGCYASAVDQSGNVSYGGTFNYADTSGTPAGGGFDVLCTNTAGAESTMGLQLTTGAPGSWNYGGEVGAFNYIQFDLKCPVSNMQLDFAAFSRCPTGDRTSRVNLANFATSGLYGPSPVANVWQTYKIPLAALYFSTPGSGIQQITASITGGVMAVTSIGSGPGGIDTPGWPATAGQRVPGGASSGVWMSDNPPSQNGNGSYALTMGTGSTPPGVGSQIMTVKRSNFYKTAIKTNSGHNLWVNNIRFTRV